MSLSSNNYNTIQKYCKIKTLNMWPLSASSIYIGHWQQTKHMHYEICCHLQKTVPVIFFKILQLFMYIREKTFIYLPFSKICYLILRILLVFQHQCVYLFSYFQQKKSPKIKINLYSNSSRWIIVSIWVVILIILPLVN